MDEKLVDQARTLMQAILLLKVWVAGRLTHHANEKGNSPCLELTLPQSNMLFVVRDRNQATIKQLAAALQVSAPSASAMVDRLVETGAVSREQNKTDRREVVVALTDAGRRSIEHMEEQMLHMTAELLEKVGPKYAAMWCEVYGRLGEVIKQELAQ